LERDIAIDRADQDVDRDAAGGPSFFTKDSRERMIPGEFAMLRKNIAHLVPEV
jgi:hypothetical protein